MSELVEKLIPVAISSIIASAGVYIAYQNRISKLREVLYEKQYLILLSLNKYIIEIEVTIQDLNGYIVYKNHIEAEQSLIRYAELIKEIAFIINYDSKLVLPNSIITKTSELINMHHGIILKITSGEYDLSSNINLTERLKITASWQNNIREHLGVEKLTDVNKKVIG